MFNHDYNKINSGYCIFIKKLPADDFIIFLLYIHDILIVGHDANKVDILKRELNKFFLL